MYHFRRGFTLVELLTVILIIGILMGLLAMGLNMAREQGRQTACLNNAMQIGRGIAQFDAANNRLPGVLNKSQGGTTYNWVEAIFPYVGRADLASQVFAGNAANVQTLNVEVLICQDDPYTVDPTGPNYNGILSYGVNNTVFCDQSKSPPVNGAGTPVVPPVLSHLTTTPPGGGATQFVHAATTIMIGECSNTVGPPHTGPWTNMTWAGLTFGWPAAGANAAASTFLSSAHPDKVIAVFFDNHGEKVLKTATYP